MLSVVKFRRGIFQVMIFTINMFNSEFYSEAGLEYWKMLARNQSGN